MYIVYLRDKKQPVYRKSTTASKEEAIKYFEEMIYRKELYGRKLVAILKFREKIKEFHRFDVDAHQSQLEVTVQKIKKRSER